MRYLPVLTGLLAAAPCVLAKSKAKINTSSSPVHHLARSPRAAVAARQGSTTSTSGGEFCGTDDSGEDWYCTDSSTFCCTGPEVWQCAPIEAEECCTTGYYCDAGTHCYLDSDDEQLCLTPEEAEDLAGDEIDSTSGSGSGSSGSGSSGSGSGSDSTSTDDDDDSTTTSSGSDDDDDSDDEDSSGGFAAGAAGGGGGKKKKGGSGSGAGRVSAGNLMVGIVAVGALALI